MKSNRSEVHAQAKNGSGPQDRPSPETIAEITPAALETGWRYLVLMRRSGNRLKTMLEEIAAPFGVTAPQFFCLHWVTQHPEVTQTELGNEVGADANTVSAIVRRLESKKLITRKKNSQDGRAICLCSTALGRRVIKRAQSAMDRKALVLASLLPEDHEKIATWLEDLIGVESE